MSWEYEELESQELIGQGDVIAWEEAAIARPWKHFGIVVTADCDLARDKHGGHITYIPALTTEDFLWHHWRPLAFEKARDDRSDKLARRIERWSEKNVGRTIELSTNAMQAWVRRAGREGVLDELECTDRGQRNDLGSIIDELAMLLEVFDGETPDIDLLGRAFPLVKSKASPGLDAVASDFQARLGTLPGDIFHLPALPGNESDGLFVMLRHVRQCRTEDIALKPDDLRFGPATARRISRISPTFRYALTQALARVFSDIGLPADHEDRRRSHAHRYFKLGQSV